MIEQSSVRSRVPPIRSLIDRSASLAALCWPLALQGEGTVRESPEWVNCRLFGLQALRVDGADQQQVRRQSGRRGGGAGRAPGAALRQQALRVDGADQQRKFSRMASMRAVDSSGRQSEAS